VLQQQTRKFSLGLMLSNIGYAPAAIMIGLHDLGLPWWSAIPLSAVTIRTCLVLPFQVLRRRKIARIALLQPIIDARMSLHRRRQLIMTPNMTWASQRLDLYLERYRISGDIGQKFGADNIVLLALAGVFFLLIVSENIRQICGCRGGLLSLFLGSYFSVEKVEAATDERRAQARCKDANGGPIAGSDASTPETSESASWYQPSLQTGGFPWCRDLTQRDPSLTLPFLFSASFMASIYFGPRMAGQSTSSPATQQSDSASKTDTEPQSKSAQMAKSVANRPGLTNLQRIMMTFAVFMIIPAINMPSALVLYFVSNLGVGAVHTRLLSKAIPIRTAPMACRRPVRMDPARERLDVITGNATKRKY